MSNYDSSSPETEFDEIWSDDEDITEAWSIAEKRGGECLSQYNSKYLWTCKKGHQWEAYLDDVKNKYTWCPVCPYTMERKCRFIFEDLLGKKFSPRSPPFLEGLRLDGYNKELGLAFEYQGRQHYEIVSIFHPCGQNDLNNQQKRDREKRLLCVKNGVTLIIIPYYADPLEFIRNSLLSLGFLS